MIRTTRRQLKSRSIRLSGWGFILQQSARRVANTSVIKTNIALPVPLTKIDSVVVAAAEANVGVAISVA